MHWTASYITASILAWIGWKAADKSSSVPRGWFAIGLSLYAFGQILWDIQVASGWNPFPGPSDLFFLCLGPCFSIGLFSCLKKRSGRGDRKLALLDSTALSVAIVALALALYLPRRGDTASFQLVVMIGYPLGQLTAACVGVVLVFLMGLGTNRRWALLLPALIVNGLLWMEWNSLTLDNSLRDGTFFNFAFSIIALALGYGSMLWEIEESSNLKLRRYSEASLLLLPIFLVFSAIASALAVWVLPDVPISVKISIYFSAFIVMMLAIARQSLLLNERTRLLEAERKVTETTLQYKTLFHAAVDSILIFNGEVFIDCNQSSERIFGCKREDIIGHSPVDFSPERQPDGTLSSVRAREYITAALDGIPQVFEWKHCRLDRTPFDAQVVLHRVAMGGSYVLQGFVRDITQIRQLQEQLQQSRKMESLGTLAGGIAHDFNNILAIITGYASAAQESGANPANLPRSLQNILTAAHRGAALVRQLLTFARKSELGRTPTQVNIVIEDLAAMLRETFPKTIQIETNLSNSLPATLSDSTQIHQVLLNLCVNARDAMPNGGEIEITTRLANQTELSRFDFESRADQYICIEVKDNGVGMDIQTSQRIFEPFFSTKKFGKGTGLGLSVAFGIVREHGGVLDVVSEPNSGSTFTVYLPVLVPEQAPRVDRAISRGAAQQERFGTVMLVEDEPALNELLSKELRSRGYVVISASDGVSALESFALHHSSISVVLSDLGLPKMSGAEFVRELRRIDSNVRVIIASGYIEPEVKSLLSSLGVVDWIQKPYVLSEVLDKLHSPSDSSTLQSSERG